jgi:uncharacterized iron-regulated protein
LATNILGFLLLAGIVPVEAMPPGSGAEPLDSIVIETASTTNLEKVLERAEAKRLVFVGETHTSVSDHELQLRVLKAMHAQGGDLTVGVEWFQRPFQEVLDRYINGDLDEQGMLRESEYFQRWGFDYRLYRDILKYARDNGIRVLALNASREISRAIREKGLEGLPDEQKAELPDSYDLDNAAYAEHLKEVFQLHQNRDHDDSEAFQRFLEVQLTWDETMASETAEYLASGPGKRILVLAGRGHTHAAAIPARVARRIGEKGLSIASYQPGGSFEQPDFLVLQPEKRLPPAGLIGVSLEEREDGVYITAISEGSFAGKAGVRAGDRILKIADTEIQTYIDVKLAMLDRKPGEKLQVGLSRKGFFGLMSEHEVEVTLTSLRPMPH